jgi:hypothetical protein
MPAEEITALFGKPLRLVNLLLRPCAESPILCHAEILRCLVEAYPSIDDVEGRACWMNHLIGVAQRTSPRFDYRGYIKHGEPNTGSDRRFSGKTGYEVEFFYEACLGLVSSQFTYSDLRLTGS